MYMCLRDIEFAYFYDFSIESFKLFRQCDIYFHLIIGCEKTITLNICYCLINVQVDWKQVIST